MEEKVIIDFDLNDEQMIREAIRNYEIYEDFLVFLIQNLDGYKFGLFYENDIMEITAI